MPLNLRDSAELEWLKEIEAGRDVPDGCDLDRLVASGYVSREARIEITDPGRARHKQLCTNDDGG